MPHHKSCKKRLKQDRTRRHANRQDRSELRSAMKSFKTLCASGEEKTPEALNSMYRALDVQSRKGVIPRKRASRLKSRMAALFSR